MRKILTLLALLMMFVGGTTAQVTDRASAGDPMTFNQFKALAGTGKHFALMAPSTNDLTYKKWFSFSKAGYPTILTTVQLFDLENSATGDGWYNIKRVSDGLYVSTEGGNFAASPKMDFKLVNRRAGDYASEFSNSDLHVSLDNAAGNHYNANTSNLGFRGGTGGYSTYITYGPFNVVTINYVDTNGDPVQTSDTWIVKEGTTIEAPSIPGKAVYGTSSVVVNEDQTITFTYVESNYDYTLVVNNAPAGATMTIKGESVAIDAPSYSNAKAVTESDVVVSFPAGYDNWTYTTHIDGTTITINIYSRKEVTAVADLTDGFYIMKGQVNGKTGYLYYDATLSDNRLYRISTSSTPEYLDEGKYEENLNFVWKLKNNGDGSFTLVNCATLKYLPADQSRNQNCQGNAIGNLVWDVDNKALYQTNYTYTDNNLSDAKLYIHCNQPGGDDNLSYWTTSTHNNGEGQGSLVLPTFYEIELSASVMQDMIANSKTILQSSITGLDVYPKGSNLGQYTATDTYNTAVANGNALVSSAAATIDDLASSNYDISTNLRGLLSLNLPQAKTFLRFKASALKIASQPYLLGERSTVNSDRLAYGTDATANSIWYYDGTNLYNYDGGFAFINNGGQADVATSAGATATSVAFEASAKGELGAYNIKFSDSRYLYAEADLYANAGSNADGNGYSFNLEEVTVLPLTLTDVSQWGVDGSYTTMYMPVNVTVSGAKVYTVTDNVNNSLTVEELAAGDVVPANTGVILEGTETDVTATVSATGGTATSVLTGTVPAIDFVDDSYVLSVYNKKLGFYKLADGVEMKGFRAYYVPTSGNVDPTRGFVLNFGDTTTGISSAVLNGNDKAYDLQGRRVNNAAKGVYIINGKKVVK